MPSLLYIHGFLSSPKSTKAVQVKKWLAENRPGINFYCPFLTPYPSNTRKTLEAGVEKLMEDNTETVYLMGSSLGGFWATWLTEKYDLKAVLINPAVQLNLFEKGYINTPLKNYHTEDSYTLTVEDIEAFREVYVDTIIKKQNYFLMVQTGDDILDYRLAVEKYAGCRQLIEEGGDHNFTDFESRIGLAMDFLES